MTASVFDCAILNLSKISNRAGSITVVENEGTLPFTPKRLFYIYDIPGGESRGGHSHRKCHQFIVAASGSFEIELDDGVLKKHVRLNRPFMGIHIPPFIWSTEVNFSSGAVCLVLASDYFDNGDYIRDYNEFLHLRQTVGFNPAT